VNGPIDRAAVLALVDDSIERSEGFYSHHPSGLDRLRQAIADLPEASGPESREHAHLGWEATAAAINALPGPVRDWIHDLETRCDPAGDLRARRIAEDRVEEVMAMMNRRRAEVARLTEGSTR